MPQPATARTPHDDLIVDCENAPTEPPAGPNSSPSRIADLDHVAPIGQTIIRLGRAWRAGHITLPDAVDQLIAEHPEARFVRRGAEMQLRAWDGAHLRYRLEQRAEQRTSSSFPQSPPRAWRKEPIHLYLPAAGS